MKASNQRRKTSGEILLKDLNANSKKRKVFLNWKIVFGILLLMYVGAVVFFANKAHAAEQPAQVTAWMSIINAMETLKQSGCQTINVNQLATYENIKSETGNAILTRGGEYLTECLDVTSETDPPTNPDSGGSNGAPLVFKSVGLIDAGNNDAAYSNGGQRAKSSGRPGVYAVQRYQDNGAKDLVYTLPVTPGEYKLRLLFEESYSGAFKVNYRVFSVVVNGEVVEPTVDIFALVGANKPFVVEALTTDIGGVITVELKRITQNPSIAAIELLSVNEGAQLIAPKTAAVTWKAPTLDQKLNPLPPDSITAYEIELCPLGRECFTETLGPVTQFNVEVIPGFYKTRIRATANSLTGDWSAPVMAEVLR